MSIWAPLFSMNWKRNQRSLKILWSNSSNQEGHNEEIREQFRGTPKVNPVTEIVEPGVSKPQNGILTFCCKTI
jgi:hypothetical protein